MGLTHITILVVAVLVQCLAENYYYPYTWQCEDERCIKRSDNSSVAQKSLSVCMLHCSKHAGVWPRPAHIRVHAEVVPINSNSITIISGVAGAKSVNEKITKMIDETKSRFLNIMTTADKKAGETRQLRRSLEINLRMAHPEIVTVTQHTDESYELTVKESSDGRIIVTIKSATYFGARHGLETLSQLTPYDHVTGGLVIPKEVEIKDHPAYPYRGILLDTSRNYVSVKSLYRLIDAMAANKLNTFHWHITDSHSFPFQSRTYPQMSQFGAYDPEKVYSEQDIINLVEFARVRGVRIVPELDAPAHVGEGWQWTDKQVTVCFAQEPWQQYCVEPPCGQLNPTNDQVYQILQGLYSDMDRVFDSDLFHMGGDEVNLNCWNTTKTITDWMAKNNFKNDEDGFHQLWNRFQTKALEKLDSVSTEPHQIVIWTSSLTEKGRVEKFLDKSRYIVQIWTTGKDEIIAELVNKGFKVIFSNYDALYFDCGFGAWVGEGNNWCSPYIGWQKVYENRPMNMLKNLSVDTSNEEIRKLVLGQEATLWTEQADDQVIDQRLWPRAAAMAERLWSDPEETWKQAEHRFLFHRERLVARGVRADTIEPLWCLQNQGHCYL